MVLGKCGISEYWNTCGDSTADESPPRPLPQMIPTLGATSVRSLSQSRMTSYGMRSCRAMKLWIALRTGVRPKAVR